MADPTRESIEELDAFMKCVPITWSAVAAEVFRNWPAHRDFMLRALSGRNEELVKRLRRSAFGTINGLPQYPALTDILNEAADALSGQSAAPASAQPTSAVPEGYRLVQTKPTLDMIRAGRRVVLIARLPEETADEWIARFYCAMLAASPAPEPRGS